MKAIIKDDQILAVVGQVESGYDDILVGATVVDVTDEQIALHQAGLLKVVDLAPVEDTAKLRAQTIARKLAENSAKFNAEIAKGCTSAKGWVDCDRTAVTDIMGKVEFIRTVTELGGDPPELITITMFDKSQVDHTFLELKQLGVAIGLGFEARFGVKQAKERLILDPEATTEEIAAIDIESGWPG